MGNKTESRRGRRAQEVKSGEKVRARERMAAQVEEGRKGKERKRSYDMEEMGQEVMRNGSTQLRWKKAMEG